MHGHARAQPRSWSCRRSRMSGWRAIVCTAPTWQVGVFVRAPACLPACLWAAEAVRRGWCKPHTMCIPDLVPYIRPLSVRRVVCVAWVWVPDREGARLRAQRCTRHWERWSLWVSSTRYSWRRSRRASCSRQCRSPLPAPLPYDPSPYDSVDLAGGAGVAVRTWGYLTLLLCLFEAACCLSEAAWAASAKQRLFPAQRPCHRLTGAHACAATGGGRGCDGAWRLAGASGGRQGTGGAA